MTQFAPGFTGLSGFDTNTAAGIAEGAVGLNEFLIQQQQNANNVNQVGPFGNVTFSRDPVTGQMTQTVTGSQNQNFINAQTEGRNIGLGHLGHQQLQNLSGATSNPFSLNGLPAAGQLNFGGLGGLPGSGDFAGERQRIENQVFSGLQNRLEPQFAQEEARLKQSLADRGIPPGSAAEANALRAFNQRKSDATIAAQTQATQLGGQEQQRLFNQALSGRQQGVGEQLSSFDAANFLRQQGLNESLLPRQVAQQEFANTVGLTQQPQFPNAFAPAQVSVPQVDFAGTQVGLLGLENNIQLQNLINQGRAGGGGGGGGGSAPTSGFGSFGR